MQKIKLIAFLVISCIAGSHAQVDFEKGYFIDNNNQKIECLIKNSSWKNNPAEFSYKLSENSTTLVAKVSEVAEFGIENSTKYLGANVQIDRSGNELSKLNFNRNPQWGNERLFLKVLVEGKATLLIYNDANLQRFFLMKENTVLQLVHKQYMSESNEARINNAFRQQLLTDVNCGEVNEHSLKEVDYNITELVNHFKKFNECAEGKYTDYTPQKRKNSLHLKITPGINYASLFIKDYYNKVRKDVQFDSKMNFRLGFEIEYVLPYNKNKWGFVVEPSYQSHSSSVEFGNKIYSINYNSLEIIAGIRYRLFLNKQSSIFINGLIGPSFPVNSKIELAELYNVSPSAGLNFGVGYNTSKISAEFRYYKNKDIMDDYLYWTALYDRLSIILGYKLF